MCGITGYFNSAGIPQAGEGDLGRAVAALRNRGPDDRGVWLNRGNVGLGHTRLSILDLSEHGHQPMVSDDGRLAMVFNGEVYNYSEIRAELSRKGHHFRGSGDSEVILAAFREWGVDAAVRRFVGMFAIALWDHDREVLTLIRDRLGVKPLYYGWNGQTLWFGSELKALRAYRHWYPEIDTAALADFFEFSYIADPRSIYRNVFKLPPGHVLELGKRGQPAVRAYWRLVERIDPELSRCDEEALAHRLESLMIDAFKLRMVSDVPVGVFLSGGVDSSAVAALLQAHGPQIHTYTIGFDDPRFDESAYAEAIAQHLGTVHTTQVVTERDAMEAIPTWGQLFDEPFGDDSGIPTLLVSKLAAQHVKVVLSADGGDELFGGYNSYAAVFGRMAKRAQRGRMERLANRLLGLVPWEEIDARLATRSAFADPHSSRGRRVSERLRYLREADALTQGPELFEHVLTSLFWRGKDLSRLLGVAAVGTRRRVDCGAYPGTLGEQMCLWDIDHYLPGDVLTKVDRTTMSVSIEGREPLLDHRLVEFASSLPYSLRRGALGSKHLLRKVLYRYVPRELIDRPKRGFAPPIGAWMAGPFRHLLDEHLEAGHVKRQGLFDPDTVASARARFRAGDPHAVQQVWLLLAFQLWHAAWMGPLARDNAVTDMHRNVDRLQGAVVA